MKTGQRFNLIKKLATRMAELTWSEGGLILKQFDLPWTDMWQGSGGQYEYLYCTPRKIEGYQAFIREIP